MQEGFNVYKKGSPLLCVVFSFPLSSFWVWLHLQEQHVVLHVIFLVLLQLPLCWHCYNSWCLQMKESALHSMTFCDAACIQEDYRSAFLLHLCVFHRSCWSRQGVLFWADIGAL